MRPDGWDLIVGLFRGDLDKARECRAADGTIQIQEFATDLSVLVL